MLRVKKHGKPEIDVGNMHPYEVKISLLTNMQISVYTLQFFGWLDIFSDIGGTIASANAGM